MNECKRLLWSLVRLLMSMHYCHISFSLQNKGPKFMSRFLAFMLLPTLSGNWHWHHGMGKWGIFMEIYKLCGKLIE